MNGQIISKNNYRVTKWSGGETTQLFLTPYQSGDFEIGKFDLRVSSATIEQVQSTFTTFRGYQRVLMTLDKDIAIQHNHGEWYALAPLTAHQFSGDDYTISRGKCTDFNVIFKSECTVDTKVIKSGDIHLKKDKQYLIYFLQEGNILENDENVLINKGDCVYFQCVSTSILIQSVENERPVGILIEFKI